MTHRTAGELAQFLDCEIEGDAEARLSGVASAERAAAADLIFLHSARHAELAARSAARCVMTTPELRPALRSDPSSAGKTLLLVSQPKLGFARAAAWLLSPPPIAQGIHSTAVIAASVSLAAGVAVGPFAVIEDDVSIGPGSQIGAFCFVGRGATIGAACRLYPRVTLYAGAQLADRVVVHSGAVLGSDGFGYVTDQGQHWKFPQVGGLEIGDDVEIGANTTVDRGSLDVTRLHALAKLDNLVHIAHNVQIGERVLIAAQTGIAGSSSIGDDTVLGGQAGIGEHCRVEDACVVGGQAGILARKVIRRGQTVWGTPARPLANFKEQYAWFARLPELAQRIRDLEGRQSQGS